MPGSVAAPKSAVRLVLCTRGGLHGAQVLDRLLASPLAQVAGIVVSTRVDGPKRGWIAGAIRRLRAHGVAYSTYLWASTAGGALRERAAREGIGLFPTRDIADEAAHAFIARCRPDLIACAFFDQRVDAATRALAPLGAVNIHPSPLPRFRGVDPVFRALLRDDGELGVTVHRVTDDWDAGPILARESCAPEPRESVLAATARLYRRGAQMLAEALPRIAAGDPGTAQDGEGCYDSWPGPADVAALSRRRVALMRMEDLWPRPNR